MIGFASRPGTAVEPLWSVTDERAPRARVGNAIPLRLEFQNPARIVRRDPQSFDHDCQPGSSSTNAFNRPMAASHCSEIWSRQRCATSRRLAPVPKSAHVRGEVAHQARIGERVKVLGDRLACNLGPFTEARDREWSADAEPRDNP